ncbi:MAG: phosphatidate cytidylyltransferase [Oscillospiraceae bacterium]
MKKRLLSIAVGLVLLAGILAMIDTVVIPIAASIVGAIAIFELTRALGLNDNKLFFILFSLAHCYNMFILPDGFYFTFVLLFIMFCLTMFCKNRHYLFKEGAAAFAGIVLITSGFRAIITIENHAPNAADARFMIIMAMCLGWICDTFAFIFGKLFGKKKLCPEISPNKTVAGAVGGIVGTAIFTAAAFGIYALKCSAGSLFCGMVMPIHIAFYGAIGLVGSIVGIVGDLSASYIKRECGIKDFGNIMPGHGGALDRFDSVLFTGVFASLVYGLFIKIF